jgi:hypothetical protein
MKIGFIVECGPQGAEVLVIPHLAKVLDRSLQLVNPVPLDNKDKLRRECGPWAKALLDLGCARVLIVWDLLPDWGEYRGKGCRHNDKKEIARSLASAGVKPSDKRIRLVCAERMVESWILADNQAVATFLSTPEHQLHVRKYKHPDEVRDPEAALNRSFRETRFRKYRDLDHAFKIIQSADLKRLRRSESFRRFEAKLLKE